MKKSGVVACFNGKSAWEMSRAKPPVASMSHLHRVLTGIKPPSVDLAERIAEYCGGTVEEVTAYVNKQRVQAVKEDRKDVYIRAADKGLRTLALKLKVKGAEGKGSPLGKKRANKKLKKDRVKEKKRAITRKR